MIILWIFKVTSLAAKSLSSRLAGDTHLAMFCVWKLEDDMAADIVEATEAEQDTDNEPDNTQTSWTSSVYFVYAKFESDAICSIQNCSVIM